MVASNWLELVHKDAEYQGAIEMAFRYPITCMCSIIPGGKYPHKYKFKQQLL